MFNRTLSALAAVALTGATLAIATPALAEPVGDPTSTTVRFGDLDLSTAKGEARLYARLSAAADEVCGTGARNHVVAMKIAECRSNAIASAKANVSMALAAKSGGRTVAMGTN
jgi:UrcA family protein